MENKDLVYHTPPDRLSAAHRKHAHTSVNAPTTHTRSDEEDAHDQPAPHDASISMSRSKLAERSPTVETKQQRRRHPLSRSPLALPGLHMPGNVLICVENLICAWWLGYMMSSSFVYRVCSCACTVEFMV